ncbi:MAG: hypothetical protein ACR2LI_07925 [Propionibacteriaceae bacterium]
MKIKNLLVLAAGAGAGYLLGTRQGRVKLEQLKTQANQFAHDPRVQSAASSAAEQVEKQAHHLPQPAQGIVRAAAGQVQSAVEKAQTDQGTTIPPAS